MKYTAEDINRYRKAIEEGANYAESVGDHEVARDCDDALDFLVWFLDIIDEEGANA